MHARSLSHDICRFDSRAYTKMPASNSRIDRVGWVEEYDVKNDANERAGRHTRTRTRTRVWHQ
jgi:hypothetical protein